MLRRPLIVLHGSEAQQQTFARPLVWPSVRPVRVARAQVRPRRNGGRQRIGPAPRCTRSKADTERVIGAPAATRLAQTSRAPSRRSEPEWVSPAAESLVTVSNQDLL